MELKSIIRISWHEGVPGGEKAYKTLCPYLSTEEEVNLKVAHDIVRVLKLSDTYGKTGYFVKDGYLYHKSKSIGIASVEVTHVLDAGNRNYFELKKADMDGVH